MRKYNSFIGLGFFVLLALFCAAIIDDASIGSGDSPVNTRDTALAADNISSYLQTYDKSCTLAAATQIDDMVILLEPGHGAIVGETILLQDALSGHTYQSDIKTVDGNSLTIYDDLDRAVPVSAFCTIGTKNLAVNGALGTQTFQLGPPPGIVWLITKPKFNILDTVAMDPLRFGSLPPLGNGLFLGIRGGVVNKNIGAVRVNADLTERTDITTYDDRAPGGTYGVSSWTLLGAAGEGPTLVLTQYDKILIRAKDDLTGLGRAHAIIRGYALTFQEAQKRGIF